MARCNRSSAPRAAPGFSLVEVLVALAILAVLASTIVFQTGTFSSQLFQLEERTVALWVAQNALEELRLAEKLELPDDGAVEVEMGGRNWSVIREIRDTPRAGFHRIEVSVAREGEDAPLLTLSGFVADK